MVGRVPADVHGFFVLLLSSSSASKMESSSLLSGFMTAAAGYCRSKHWFPSGGNESAYLPCPQICSRLVEARPCVLFCSLEVP